MAEHTDRIGLIGVGNMGSRMGRRVIDAGTPLVAFDVDVAKPAQIGATAATSVAEVVEKSDVVLMSLPDSRVIEAIANQADGLLSACRSGQVIIDLSTANPSSTIALHDAFAEHGVEYLDAGISGGASGAEQGTLAIMVGGSAETLERVRPVLDCFSEHIYFMGESGAGHATKVLNNYLNGITLAATAEVMVAAKKAGLDLEQVLDVINHSSGVSYASLERFPYIVKGDYKEGGLTGDLMAKDVQLYVDVMKDLKATSVLGASCLLAFQLSNALGYGNQISNRVVDALGDLSGGVRIADSVRSTNS